MAVNDLATLNAALSNKFASKDGAQAYMLANKTEAALAVFESDTKLVMPPYIHDAVQ